MVDEDVKEALLAFAEKAARNTGGTVADVFRRKKSQSYLLGKVHKRFPERDVEELRAIIISTRWEILEDPSKQEAFALVRRPPPKGREALESPVWDARIADLDEVLGERPVPTPEIVETMKAHRRWSRNFTISVLSAADLRRKWGFFVPWWARREAGEKWMAQIKALRAEVPHRELAGPVVAMHVEQRGDQWAPFRVYSEDQMTELQARRAADEGVSGEEANQDGDMAKAPAPELTPAEKLEKIKASRKRTLKFEGRLQRRKEALMRAAEEKVDAELAPTRKLAESARRTFEADLALLDDDEPEEDDGED